MKRRHSRRLRGFTLIELLVVISIIGMLSSVVLASVQSARDKGRIASGLVFERHTKDAFGDKILAEYNFDATTLCPNGSGDPTLIGISTVSNIFGSSGLNLRSFNPNVACNTAFSSDTPTGKGSSLNFAVVPTSGKFFLNGTTPVNTGITFSKFSVGFWIKATSNLAQTKTIQITANSGISIIFNIDLTNATKPFFARFTTNIGGSYTDFVNLSPSILIDGKWHYVFASINTAATKVYVDGKINTGGTPYTNLTLDTSSSFDNIEFQNDIAGGDNTSATLLIDNLILIGDAP